MLTREILEANQKMLEEQLQETLAQLRRIEGALSYNKLLLDKLEAKDEQPTQSVDQV